MLSIVDNLINNIAGMIYITLEVNVKMKLEYWYTNYNMGH